MSVIINKLKQVIKNKMSYVNNNFLLDRFIDKTYREVLGRKVDPHGLSHFKREIRSGMTQPSELRQILVSSGEFIENQFSTMRTSIHESRRRFVAALPKAETILDLGGAAQGLEVGALVAMKYPYKFNKLTIVDLPINERHEIYQNNDENVKIVQSPLGIVEYKYQSMVDLSNFGDESFDLVYSGQTIEHITEEEGDKMLHEVMRVLKSEGYFCVDTPNGAATRLQQETFIDPDHKIEYTHEQLSQKLLQNGFDIRLAQGMNYLGKSFENNSFNIAELCKNVGLYNDLGKCYLISYICQKN